jgi:hypothetical protein
MDEIDLLKESGPEPEDPEPQVLHAARNALVRRAAGRPPFLAVLAGGRRYRALAPAFAIAAVAAVVGGAALIGRIPGGTPAGSPSASAPASPTATASPTGRPMPRELAALADQIITRARQRSIPAGKYLYSKWTDGTDVVETWEPSDQNATWYFRENGGSPTLRSGDAVLDAHTRAELTQGPDQFLAEFRNDPDTVFHTLEDLLVGPSYGPLMTGAQRSTGFQVMLKLPGITFHASIPTHAGVQGAAFTYRDRSNLETDIIVDPETGDVIGETGPHTVDGGPGGDRPTVPWSTSTISVVSTHP